MNINDPFGRMESRRQRDYQSLRRSLQRAGLTNRSDAERLLVNLKRRQRVGLALVLAALLVALIWRPEWLLLSLVCAGLIAAWLVNATRRGCEFIQRYIAEELTDDDSAAF